MSFDPVMDKHTLVMVFGSYPGEESLRRRQYYANPRNQFWRIMEHVLDENLVDKPYEERLNILLEYGIGLWDAYESCKRKGSLDAAIRQGKLNDFSRLDAAPRLKAVFFNGQKSASAQDELSDYATHVLPSSSPAHAVQFKKKADEWKRAFQEYLRI